jgi:hypothetical protein
MDGIAWLPVWRFWDSIFAEAYRTFKIHRS